MSITNELIARMTSLVSGLAFDYKPTGETKAVQVVDSFLERPTSSWVEGGEFPFVRIAHYSGAYFSGKEEGSLVVVGGIWTKGNVASGTADIKRLAEALKGLTLIRMLGEYKISTPIKYYFGQTDPGREGVQPHPYHFVTLYLDFAT